MLNSIFSGYLKKDDLLEVIDTIAGSKSGTHIIHTALLVTLMDIRDILNNAQIEIKPSNE